MEIFNVVTIIWCSVLALSLGFAGYLIMRYQVCPTA
jgi:hypothetical protein